MLVQKFGGTSLSTANNLNTVADIICNTNQNNKCVIVLSAMGKVTDSLVSITESAIANKDWQQEIESLESQHHNTIAELDCSCGIVLKKQQNIIHYLFEQTKAHLQGVELLKQCPADIYASLITLGEQLSVAIMTLILETKGKTVDIIDSRKTIIVNDIATGEINLEKTTQNFNQYKNNKSDILLMAGFSASSNSGKSTTLGRNGSDYSAALAAICLDADACQIWTDVDGVYNANPKEIKSAQLITHLSYNEAMELSYFGASVLHPKTITPLMHSNIPCHIRNTFNRESKGTTISNAKHRTENLATAISSLQNITMVTVCGPGMKGIVGMAARVFTAMAHENISMILITQSSSEYSISFCIDNSLKQLAKNCLEKTFSLELKNNLLEPIEFKDNLAIITLISDNMKKRRGTAAQFFHALAIANVNIVAIAQGSNERSISAVIEKDRTTRGLKSCHQLFFDSRQQVEIILIGCGLVGKAFLSQIDKQHDYLRQHNIKIKVCGIVNSKGALLLEEGIDTAEYTKQMQENLQSIDRAKLKLFRQQSNMINPIIVDCTSSQRIADAYLDFFKAGYHVVAANKKANSSSVQYHADLRKCAIKHNRLFNYETNVGAGLPVIDTIRNLLRAGDSMVRFEGILSGSMSYIFGKLEEGLTLSQAVIKAKDKGFTEPDPRDDLSGMDIARKVLIIAREAGLNLELSDVNVESLLTDELINCESTDQFMELLPTLDTTISELNQQAQTEKSVLRYIGIISNNTCSVKIKMVDSTSPLYSIKDGENAISFYSRYYQPIPMVLRGYGAGAEVTAAGIFSDVMKIIPSKNSVI